MFFKRFLCSTPFGIIGRLTLPRSVKEPWQCRAQRLSASSEDSPTGCRASDGSQHWVLNAFRHHRKAHKHDPRLKRGAFYVLNAFRHHRKTHRKNEKEELNRLLCAQRLSASSEDSP